MSEPQPPALRPADAQQVEEAVAAALAGETPLEICGAGTKRTLGRPLQAARTLDTSALRGVSLYEPEELVLTAGAGTPLAEIEALLAENNQQLAFEPPDLGPLLGGPADAATLAGCLACNLAGPRRLKAGAARDHILGVHAVSGRGEAFKSGGRVVKNVTGYDLSKLVTGSYGTLAVITQATVKVLPAPEKTRTVLVYGLEDAAAVAAMTEALSGSHDVSGAAHLPPALANRAGVDYVADAGHAVTALRLEGVGPSVEARCAALRTALAGFGRTEELHGRRSATLWRAVRDVVAFHRDLDRPLWRLSVPPQSGPDVMAALSQALGGEAYYDWGGGLIWLALPPETEAAGHAAVRSAVDRSDGHATLIRAPKAVRASVPVFHPLPEAVAGVTRRVKDGFDPKRILNPGRMYAGI